MIEQETVRCPLCGRAEATFVWPARDRRYGLPGDFSFVKCVHCGLVYLNPRPTLSSIWVYYPSNYESFVKQPADALPLWRRYSLYYGLWKRCRVVLRYKRRGRLLDFGCGTGQFLAAMRRYPGWEVMGIEPHEEAARFGRSVLGLHILKDLSSARFPDHYFDVITMWDVIEHLHDPVAVLHEIRRILKRDGLLILRTPSLDSWDAHVFGKYWGGLDAPRHLIVYSRDTITRLLAHAGFVVRDFRNGGGSYFVLVFSFRFWLEEVVQRSWMKKCLSAFIENPVTRAALIVPLALVERLGRGSELLVVAHPNPQMDHG